MRPLRGHVALCHAVNALSQRVLVECEAVSGGKVYFVIFNTTIAGIKTLKVHYF